MALAARTIVSRLSGPVRPVVDNDDELAGPSQAEDALTELELDAAWRNERPFGRDSQYPPMTFVPARLKFDDFGQLLNPQDAQAPSSSSRAQGGRIGSWYSSLPRSSSSTPAPSTSAMAAPLLNAPAPAPQRPAKVTKNDWFLQKVLAAEPAPLPSPAPSLSDMLEREPPCPAGGFKVPVWTAIGPGNRGFALLQRSGWEEGQGLGPGAAGPSQRRVEQIRVPLDNRAEVIDLTGDDGDDGDAVDLTGDDDSDDTMSGDEIPDVESDDMQPKLELDVEELPTDSHGTALLVPLPAFLKPDKHGIGVRAAAERKMLRLKSTAQAIAASTPEGTKRHQHIAAAARKRRAEVGRGARGFARMNRSESDQRQAMMSYMNS
ncbi:hypothetical protein EXIGLDRAFT_718233 [Exidia glandulosa HHB12029]|uniref:G-patch domain-containing protein n=1 Tax=Exidia glandulosa HHB12029 TaxID=1314781 RepID=A0A165HWM8_EXIGL|nr:hypothetical protein EXIGLDRAFT_718233 [Exidia glandulosa HHB12029]